MNQFRKTVNKLFDLVGLRNFFLVVGFLAALFGLLLAGAQADEGRAAAGGTVIFGGLCMVAAAIVDRRERADEPA